MAFRRARVLVAAAVLAVVPVSAVAQQPDSLEQARDRVEQLEGQSAAVKDRVQAAREHLDALTPRLRETSEALADAEAEATEARRAAEAARARAERVQERLEEAKARLAANRDELAELARDAYMYGPAAGAPVMAALEQLSTTSNPNEVADIVHMVDVALGDRALLVDQSVRLIEETAYLRERVRETREEREREAEAATRAEDRAAARHAEMMALLDEADRALATERQALADLRSQTSDAKDRVDELEQARRRARQQAAAAVGVTSAGGGLVTVGGITVAESLGPQLEALLEAARADGIVLGGSGYRSPQTTVRLRRANGCPDVYSSPASACRVPTARPGTSMHEQGLAVDFTYQGQTICYPSSPAYCSGNPAFDWLQAHAHEYGLFVLSSEAWHWSTNGN